MFLIFSNIFSKIGVFTIAGLILLTRTLLLESSMAIERAPENIKTQTVLQEETKVLPQKTEKVEKAVLQVPENEVRNLVRTARKTLNDSN